MINLFITFMNKLNDYGILMEEIIAFENLFIILSIILIYNVYKLITIKG